jgi:DNA-binding GntR family transcriptional regulator
MADRDRRRSRPDPRGDEFINEHRDIAGAIERCDADRTKSLVEARLRRA